MVTIVDLGAFLGCRLKVDYGAERVNVGITKKRTQVG